MKLENYLRDRYSPLTAKAYQRDIDHYLQRQKHAKAATYGDILNYLEWQRRSQSPASVHRILQSIKKYYYYLIETDQREDHPCESLKIKDHRRGDIQLQDLFSTEELATFLEIKSRYGLLQNRNRLILSLLIYQGLSSGELARLRVKDMEVERGTVYIASSHRLNGRRLQLQSTQIMLAYHYINKDRPQLLKTESDQLLLTKTGSEEKGEGISYLVSTLQKQFPTRKLNPKTIRQSVIANQLKAGNDLRAVQLFAGHKNPSSTERYRQTHLDGLKAAIIKYHPLG